MKKDPFKNIIEAEILDFNIAAYVMAKCPYCGTEEEYLIYNPSQFSIEYCMHCEKEFKIKKIIT